jgi:hypothetical protein
MSARRFSDTPTLQCHERTRRQVIYHDRVQKIMTTKRSRNTLIRIICRDGLRVGEAINLRPARGRSWARFMFLRPIGCERVWASKRGLAAVRDAGPWPFLSGRRSDLTIVFCSSSSVAAPASATSLHRGRATPGVMLSPEKGTDLRVIKTQKPAPPPPSSHNSFAEVLELAPCRSLPREFSAYQASCVSVWS